MLFIYHLKLLLLYCSQVSCSMYLILLRIRARIKRKIIDLAFNTQYYYYIYCYYYSVVNCTYKYLLTTMKNCLD